MKKGFTLIELLAVIIILAIIALIATPVIIKVVDSAKESARKSSVTGYADAVKLAINESMFENKGLTPTIDNNFLSSITYQGESVSCNNVVSSNNYGVVLHQCTVGNNTNLYCYLSGKVYSCDDTYYTNIYNNLDKTSEPSEYTDNSGANKPVLYNNMIPVYYDGTNWIYADIHNKWYDYDSKEWANAAVLNSDVTKKVGDTIDVSTEVSQMYVWIPRYKYTIFNGNNGSAPAQEINVAFESGTESTGTVNCTDAVAGSGTSSETCIDTTNGSVTNSTSTYTHPAFTFGSTSLTGFWLGKFEISGSTISIEILPNSYPMRNYSISEFFTVILNISTKYSINADSHMIKNIEWGAVAYLKQSKYGLGTTDISRNNSSTATGCSGSSIAYSGCQNSYDSSYGQTASTTGNIYGVYDMSGGSEEYVMGDMVTSSGQLSSGNSLDANSGFNGNTYFNQYVTSSISFPNEKYFDKYSYGTDYANDTYTRGKLGDATKEILYGYGSVTGGWTDDLSEFVYNGFSWFSRGGNYNGTANSGIFNFNCVTGNSSNLASTRVTITAN